MQVGRNPFSLSYYRTVLQLAKKSGYQPVTLSQFWEDGCPNEKYLVLRHDVDTKPHTLRRMLNVEREESCRSTLYVRVAGAQYNFLDYPTFSVLREAENDGFEIGLHTNYVEFAEINKLPNALALLESETNTLRSFFDVKSLAPHRDHSYAFNSLPHIIENWNVIEKRAGYKFHAYDDKILLACEYVNEGYELHLEWRNKKPEEVIPTGKSMCLMTHSHWWYENNPFEEWR